MPIIHPEELVGYTLNITTQDDGQSLHIHIVEAIKDHQNNVDELSTNVQFKCSINKDIYEDILTYNQILEYMSKDEEMALYGNSRTLLAIRDPSTRTIKITKGHLTM